MGNLSLNIGLNALLASQSALDTIGHNIANANTPGYSRQSLRLQPARTMQLRGLQLGSGVDARTVERTVDEFINRRLYGQVSAMKHIEARLGALSEAESLLGEPGGTGIASVLEGMFTKFAELSSAPQDAVSRSAAVQSVDALAGGIRQVGGEFERMDAELRSRIEIAAKQVNTLARGVTGLNQQIIEAEARGASANDLRDQRELLVRQLSEQLGVTSYEGARGELNVFVDGQMLVGNTTSNDLLVARDAEGGIELSLAGGTRPVDVRSGAIGGLISIAESTLPELRSDLDRLAQGLILEVNRRHSTGTPPSGGFQQLTGDARLVDGDGDGSVLDERLGTLGGPFPVQSGELFVHVRQPATGEVQTHRLEIDGRLTTVGDLLQQISNIDQLSAGVDAFGRVQIQASGGFTFDFSRRLDTVGNRQGTLGGAQASLGSLSGAPFALTPGDTLTLDGGAGPFAITFAATDFENIGAATAEEVAAVINANPSTASSGLRALAQGDRVFVQSMAQGASASFDVVGGGAALALGWTPGTAVAGQDRAVDVELSGVYSGSDNQRLTFRPNMDGEIGATAGLAIEVLDESGARVAVLDVGADYRPGTALAVIDGVSATFSSGPVSASDGDAFVRDLLADADTSDVLVALGLNGLLTGTDAGSIAVSERLLSNPQLLAASANGNAGDNGALLDLLSLQELQIDGLQNTIAGFYGATVGDLGLQTQSGTRALEIEGQLMASLETRRDQVSGVSLDEELVNLIQFEQAFGAAARFIQVANSLQDEVMNLI